MSLKSFLLQMVCLKYFVTTRTETNDVSISKTTTQVAATKWALRSQEERRLYDTVYLFTAHKELEHLKMLASKGDPGLESLQNSSISLGYDCLTSPPHVACIVLSAL